MNQNLTAMLDIKRNSKEKSWTFQSIVNENTVKVFCRGENIAFDDIVEVEATTEIFYKYPLLFDVWDAG